MNKNGYIFIFSWLALSIALMGGGLMLANHISDTLGVMVFLSGLLSLIVWFIMVIKLLIFGSGVP